ncbi:MAG: hypothetical protein K2G81_03375, partial [Muribaculaceae bacterium]|nr:hypothetical protein [Muribaculaceae bacterium]
YVLSAKLAIFLQTVKSNAAHLWSGSSCGQKDRQQIGSRFFYGYFWMKYGKYVILQQNYSPNEKDKHHSGFWRFTGHGLSDFARRGSGPRNG